MRIRDAYTKLDRPTRAEGPAAAGTRAKDAGHSAPAAKAESASTNVSLSARAQELASRATAETGKVAALREQVKSGQLRVDARAIASKMMGDEA
jgi:flagellar biosynthesis anti-sigma factor FlgM